MSEELIFVPLKQFLRMRDLLVESKCYLEDNHISGYDNPHLNTRNMNLRIEIDKHLKGDIYEQDSRGTRFPL